MNRSVFNGQNRNRIQRIVHIVMLCVLTCLFACSLDNAPMPYIHDLIVLPQEATLSIGQEIVYRVEAKYEDGDVAILNDVFWNVSNPFGAVISEDGTLEAIDATGETPIYVFAQLYTPKQNPDGSISLPQLYPAQLHIVSNQNFPEEDAVTEEFDMRP